MYASILFDTYLSIILDSMPQRVNNSRMFDQGLAQNPDHRAIVIGAGMGGLATALRLKAVGLAVTLIDAHDWPGGKMRTVPSAAGPVDAGPTVLTMKHVFDDLFAATGAALEDHVTLVPEPLLARHFWPDGSRLDLTNDPDQNRDAVAAFAGETAAHQFERFSTQAANLFELFDAPMMQSADPQIGTLAKAALSAPKHMPVLSPFATLDRLLRKRFDDPRLRQLFGRYATYVGGSPAAAPAILALIWHAEASGIWRVEGGMHRLARALADRFLAMGGTLLLGGAVDEIEVTNGSATGVRLANGTTLSANTVVFCGDPRALATGRMGEAVDHIAPETRTTPRSLSARVWSFAARPDTRLPLAHHNIFFAKTPGSEFRDIAQGRMPNDPTLYLCAEDRGAGTEAPDSIERFEIILNAAPLTEAEAGAQEVTTCHQTTFQTLRRFGLTFDPEPNAQALATPTTYETLFPASAGALYGQSPHGMTASLKRPRARTAIRGLYLAGGGTHPGAGVPMAALSGRHAAEAIVKDLVST